MKNTTLALMMMLSTATLAGEHVHLNTDWVEYALEEGRSQKSWTFHHNQSGQSQHIKFRKSTRGNSSKMGSFGKSKRKTTVTFHHPTLDSSAKLIFKGRGFRVKGISMVGQKRPTTLELVLGKKKSLGQLTFNFDSPTVFSGTLEGQRLEIIQEGDRNYVKNGFLQRTLFRFIPIGRFRMCLDGEMVGWIDTPFNEEGGELSLSLAEHLPDQTRGHLMSTTMGFFMMAEFLNDLD